MFFSYDKLVIDIKKDHTRVYQFYFLFYCAEENLVRDGIVSYY